MPGDVGGAVSDGRPYPDKLCCAIVAYSKLFVSLLQCVKSHFAKKISMG